MTADELCLVLFTLVHVFLAVRPLYRICVPFVDVFIYLCYIVSDIC